MVTRPSILLIDDSPGERELFRLALAQTGLDVTLYTEQDTEAAFRFLESQWTAPAVVPLRASNEALLRARVARAQDHAGVVHSEPFASTETMPVTSPSLPSLILLDLNLRGEHGCNLLKRLRSDDRFAALPVVVFTTSDDPADLAHSYSCGASGYVVKPDSFDALVHCTADLCRYWLTWNRSLMGETQC
ncbi:MAG: response regulator [Nitrospirae bacterium]|nr:response regulator [Nitrospirota bacterium]